VAPAQYRMVSISSAEPTTPSLTRNPQARSKSSPGVRIVTVSGRPFSRISSGSSAASESTRCVRAASRTRRMRRFAMTRVIREPFRSPVSVLPGGRDVVAPARVAHVLDVLEAETALDAQVAVGDRVVVRGGHLDDPVVLDVQGEIAAHPAVGADRGRLRLPALVPGALGAHVELGLERQRPGGTDLHAVAAVDARGVGERGVELGGDRGVEAAAGDADGEGVLPLLAAGVHALVAQDALGVVADVKVVVHLRRLLDGRGVRPE